MADPGPAERDPGLDFIRALALVLMAAAHFTPPGLADVVGVRLIAFVGRTAPAFYFFAFGMTADRFMGKDRGTKLEQIALFLYVALAHNAMVADVWRADFLFNLWVWRVVLYAVESRRRLPGWVYPAWFAAVTVVLAAGPRGLMEFLFQGKAHGLPLLPMGLFVFGGVIYGRASRPGQRRFYALVAGGLAAAVAGAYLLGGRPENFYVKNPMTAPYLLTLTFINIAVLEAVRAGRNWYRRAPVVPGLMEFVSRNLLLATVLHYFMLSFVNRVGPYLEEFHPAAMAGVNAHSTAVLAGGAAVVFLGTAALVWLVLFGWERVRDRDGMVFLRERYHGVAVLLVITLIVIDSIRTLTVAPSRYPLGLGPFYSPLARLGCDLVIVAVMTYFSLELITRRNRASPRSGPSGAGPAAAGSPGPA